MHGRRIAVIGLGYVGLPVAAAFGRQGLTIGFDIDASRIAELRRGRDRTGELSAAELEAASLQFTNDAADLAAADFFIVTVPTPVDKANQPDLGALRAASRVVGRALRPGAIVVYESTVYPGATEDECVPVLEAASGLSCGRDFTVGYSPERINPGDPQHRFESIVKVVSGGDAATADTIAAVYGSVVTAGVHRAPSIRVAEAAKVIENAQRDINIAFMNELSSIFERLGLDTADVLAAAGTKWNFLRFTPGLVGGHCIGVDPYYLTHCSAKAGYNPEIILSGRRINDAVAERIARECVRLLLTSGQGADRAGGARVIMLGLTFKEDVPDLRNSKAAAIVTELARFGIEVAVVDPLASAADAKAAYCIELQSPEGLAPADAVILAVPHRRYAERQWDLILPLLRQQSGAVLDVKGVLDRRRKPEGVTLWRL